MLDKQFDNIINNKMKDLKIDVPDSDWNVFSQKLKVAMESTGPQDHLFDEAIKSKLAAADIDVPKPEWSAFAAMLNADNDSTDADFDAAIKDKVENPDIEIPQADWPVFATMLNADVDTADADFDAAIKDKVENPDIEIPQADWPVFAGLLAGSMSTAGISDSNFDTAIQNTLENNPVDIPTPNWNAFSQKLQEASITDQEMDSELKAKLENHTTRFNESHWSILRDKMIETKYLRRNLYGLKWFEAALAVLLFMTFFNFIADKFIPDTTQSFAETAIDAATTATNENVIKEVNNLTKATATAAITQSIVATSIPSLNQETTSSNATQTSNRLNDAGNSVVRNGANNNNDNSNNVNNEASNNAIVSNPNNTVVNTIVPPTREGNPLTSIASEDKNSSSMLASLDKAQNTVSLQVLTGINALRPELFNSSREIADLNLETSPVIKITESIEKNGWAIHAVIGNNNHLISTPQDTFVYTLPYTHSSNNLNFDLRVSKEFNKLELMTGIAYQAMQYESTESSVAEYTEIDGEEFYFNIDKIRYDLIKIPATVRWNYHVNEKLNFFADLGVSANILASSDYNIKQNPVLTGSEPAGPKPQSNEFSPDLVYADWENTSMALKNYQKGLFNGASLKESIHGTLDTGIGVNYKLNKKIETYARGTVSQALGIHEIGPNHDSYTTFGLQLGLKYNLTK